MLFFAWLVIILFSEIQKGIQVRKKIFKAVFINMSINSSQKCQLWEWAKKKPSIFKGKDAYHPKGFPS